MSYLSPAQLKARESEWAPYSHAIDRLVERHFPDMERAPAASLVQAMTILCRLRDQTGDRETSRLVNVETPTSHIVDLDMFEDRERIRVCYDPVANVIKTVFPKQ